MAEAVPWVHMTSGPAFENLHAEWRSKIFRYCLAMARNPEDAADLTQEIFLKAVQAWPTFRGESQAATWLFRISVNHCRNYVTHRGVVAKVISPDPSARSLERGDATQNPAAQVEQASLSEALREALQLLGEREREVLTLYFLEEWSCQEIAEMLGISRVAVKVRLFRARRKLADHLGPLKGELL